MIAAASTRADPARPPASYLVRTVDVYSPWFPVRGAANGTGISYALALAYAAAPDRFAARPIAVEIRETYGDRALGKLSDLLFKAQIAGHLTMRRP